MAVPEPTEVAPWYLRNITQALELNAATGQVYVRTNAAIVGNVTVANVDIGSMGNVDLSGNTLPVTIDSGNVTVYQGTTPWVISNTNAVVSGTVAATQSGAWTVNVQDGGNTLTIDGTVAVSGNIAGITALPPITGSVSITGNANVTGNVGIIGNIAGITANVTVVDGGGSLTVDGNVNATITSGNVTVSQLNPSYTTAFQEVLAVPFFPEIQVDAVYGLPTDQMYTREIGSATAGALTHQSLFYANSSTALSSAGLVASKAYMRYRPGQGAMARFTAAYTMANATAGVANVRQTAGLFHTGEGYFFGFSGDTASGNTGVGILHSYGGEPEIRTLTIGTAPTGAQTATITLNGTAYTASITSGNTNVTASQIASGNTYGNIWKVDSVGNTVTFSSTSAGPKTGTYSLSSSGTGTLATGTFSQNNLGVVSTNDWTYQSSWNGTPITFDPSYLNVYAIDFRWLGAGIVRFFMEDPTSGELVLVHTQHWTSLHSEPHVYNPSFKLGWISTVLGTASQAGVVTGASGLCAIQGPVEQVTPSKSWYALNASTRAQNTLHHLLSIHNPYHRNGQENTAELVFQDLSVALQNTDPAVVFMFINGTPSTPLLFDSIPNSSAVESTTTATFSTSTSSPVSVFTVGISGNSQFDLIPFRLAIAPGDTLNICVQSTNQITNSSIGIVWQPQ